MLRLALKVAFGTVFIAAGCAHFAFPAVYARAMPPALPWPVFLVYLSGLCEAALGAGLFTPFSKLAAWGLVALLLAVFPANWHMARHPELFPQIAPWMLWARVPLQLPLIAWAWAYT